MYKFLLLTGSNTLRGWVWPWHSRGSVSEGISVADGALQSRASGLHLQDGEHCPAWLDPTLPEGLWSHPALTIFLYLPLSSGIRFLPAHGLLGLALCTAFSVVSITTSMSFPEPSRMFWYPVQINSCSIQVTFLSGHSCLRSGIGAVR